MENYMGMAVDMLNEESKRKDERIKELVREIEEKVDRISDLELDLKAANEKSRDISSKNSFLFQRIRVLKNQLDDYERTNENLKASLESLQSQTNSWEEAAMRNYDRATTYFNELEDANAENESLRNDKEFLKKCIKDRDEQIEKLNTELAIARLGLQTMMRAAYIDSNVRARAADETFKAIDEAIRKLEEDIENDD